MSMLVNNSDTAQDGGEAVPASTLPASSITTDNTLNSLEGRTQSETNNNIATRLDALAQSGGGGADDQSQSTLSAKSVLTDNSENILEGENQQATNADIAKKLKALIDSIEGMVSTGLLKVKPLGSKDEYIELSALNLGAGQFTYTVPEGAEVGSWFDFVLDAQVGWPNKVVVKFPDDEAYRGNNGGTFQTRERYTRTRFIKTANGWI